MSEEQQILDLVRRARTSETFREELTTDVDRVVQEQGFSPAVAEAVKPLVPYLTIADEPPTHQNWWR